MMSDALRQSMKRFVQLTEAEYDYILSHFRRQAVRKKEHIFRAGEICKLAVYCEEGCFRKYYLNDEGEEIVVDFAIEDYWIGDLNSLYNRVPTPFSFQALEDSILQVAPISDWEKISMEIPEFGKMRYAKEKRHYNKNVELLTLEKFASAAEKYEKLLERFPGITNRVAGKYIASYLSIKPESLSRLKKLTAGKKT